MPDLAETDITEADKTPPPAQPGTTVAPSSNFDEKQMLDLLGKEYGQYAESQKREADIYAKHAPELEKRSAAMEAEIQQQQANRPTVPQVPTQPEVPQRSKFTDPTAAKGLFAVASLIAGLAMAGGRGRGMLAMAGMTGAIQGFREGNLERYKAGIEEYKNQIEAQTRAYDEQYKSYMAIIQGNRLSLDEKIQMYELEAQRQHDEVGAELARQKQLDGMIKHTTEIQKMSYEMKKNALLPAEEAHKEAMMAYQERIAKIHEQTAQVNLTRSQQIKKEKEKDSKDIEHLKMAIGTEQKTLAQMMQEKKERGAVDAAMDFISGGTQAKKMKQNIEEKQARIAELQQKMNNLILKTQVRDAVADTSGIEVGEPLELP